MTGCKELLKSIKPKEKGVVTFGDNSKGTIKGIGSISISKSTMIDDVLLVKGLKHNLLSISQLCDKGYEVKFTPHYCTVSLTNDKTISFKGH